MRQLVLLFTSVLLLPGFAAAVPVQIDDLIDGALHDGQVSRNGWSDGPTAVDFWLFSGSAGDSVLLSARNDSADGDLLFALYAGRTSRFEEFLATPAFFTTPFDWGGLTGLLQFELAAGMSFLQDFMFPLTGDYTMIVGGSGFGVGNDIRYSTRASVQAVPVPEPGPLALLSLGVIGIAAVRRVSAAPETATQ